MMIAVDIFNESEKICIRKEFTYEEEFQEGAPGSTLSPGNSFNFTDRNLNSTHHALLKNLSSRSIILAPFNTTKSKLSELAYTQTVQDMMIEKNLVLKFAMRVKEIDKNYEMNNNCDLDNGVFNKFAQAAEKQAHEQKLRHSRVHLTGKSSGSVTVDKLEAAIRRDEEQRLYFD